MKIQLIVFYAFFTVSLIYAGDAGKSDSGKMSYDDSSSFNQNQVMPQDNSGTAVNMQMLIQRNIRMLNDIRKNLTDKSDALLKMKEKMTAKNIPDIDSKIEDVSKIIDEALALSLIDFESKKQQLAQRIVNRLFSASSDEQKTNRNSEGKRPQPQRHELQNQSSPISWIDVHGHLLPEKKDFKTSVEAALAAMNEANIRKMIFMPPPQCESNQHYDCDSILNAIRNYPSRIAFMGGGGTLNVTIHKYANQKTISESVKQRFEQDAASLIKKGAAGFGEIAIHHISHTQGQPYENVAADHPLMLLLADMAAKYDVPIDVHFDVVTQDMELPAKFSSPPNPNKFVRNIDAFERLLAYNPKARICWAHAGTDLLGQWTIDLSRRLLQKYPNLYMSLRIGPPEHPNGVFAGNNRISQDWVELLSDFPDRFVIGADQFIGGTNTGPGQNPQEKNKRPSPTDSFSKKAPVARMMTNQLLSLLPPDLAKKIAYENAMTIYKLKD